MVNLVYEAQLWYIYFAKTKNTTKEPHMFILYDILGKLKNEFAHSRKGDERGISFVYTIIAIIIPFTSSKTSNIFRCLKTLFGFTGIRKKNDSIHSWLHPRFPGIGCGKLYGK